MKLKMTGRSALALTICVVVAVRTLAAAPSPSSSLNALPREPAAPIPGTLFLCGGGKLPDRVIDEFVKLAGGEKGRLIVVTTASVKAGTSREDELVEPWRNKGLAHVEVRHIKQPSDADSEIFTEPLSKATAVWFCGGDQSRPLQAYRDTRFLDGLRVLLARGGVIGGTSAGAAVMSEVAIVGGKTEPQTTVGFGFLPGSIVDQHYLKFKRQTRLLKALQKHPGRVGFGIDEATALVVQGRELRVVGDSSVTVVLAASQTRPMVELPLKEHMREDLVALSRAALARAGEPYPPVRPAAPSVEKGSLVIVGGGGLHADIQKRFVELAGGSKAKIVVIPTAGERPEDDTNDKVWLERAGAKNVVVLHAGNRAAADSPDLLAKLKDASGVWFGGGRQWRFVDAYEGTKCYEAFHDVLRRGGVIGGSSAGATIQGDYLVRGSPLRNTIMMAEGYERGFAFLPGAAIDQHFTQRKRAGDMEALKSAFPQLLGLGIDEATAVVVRGAKMEVIGANQVSVYPPSSPSANKEDDATSPPHILKPGDTYDLQNFQPGK